MVRSGVGQSAAVLAACCRSEVSLKGECICVGCAQLGLSHSTRSARIGPLIVAAAVPSCVFLHCPSAFGQAKALYVFPARSFGAVLSQHSMLLLNQLILLCSSICYGYLQRSDGVWAA
jgi:hypothetical protein